MRPAAWRIPYAPVPVTGVSRSAWGSPPRKRGRDGDGQAGEDEHDDHPRQRGRAVDALRVDRRQHDDGRNCDGLLPRQGRRSAAKVIAIAAQLATFPTTKPHPARKP